LRELGLDPSVPVLAVGAPEWLDEVRGDIAFPGRRAAGLMRRRRGARFTFQTMVTPPFDRRATA